MPGIHFSSQVDLCAGSYCSNFEFTLYETGTKAPPLKRGWRSRKVHLSLKHVGGQGVFVSTHCLVKADVEKVPLLEYINVLNIEFLFMKAYMAQEGMVELALFSKGLHDQAKTLLLLEDIYFDMHTFMEHELTDAYFQ